MFYLLKGDYRVQGFHYWGVGFTAGEGVGFQFLRASQYLDLQCIGIVSHAFMYLGFVAITMLMEPGVSIHDIERTSRWSTPAAKPA